MRRLLRAVRLAAVEFNRALDWPDWEQRRVLFEAMDLFDQDDDPRAEAAFYLTQDHLKRLNADPSENGSTPEGTNS